MKVGRSIEQTGLQRLWGGLSSLVAREHGRRHVQGGADILHGQEGSHRNWRRHCSAGQGSQNLRGNPGRQAAPHVVHLYR